MRLTPSRRWFPMLLTCWLLLPGCELDRSWFSMSSDSPMPWFGFDLIPRRRTTQTLPRMTPQAGATRAVATKSPTSAERRRSPERIWSKELRLPPAPVFFDHEPEEELSFKGPTGPFSR